MINPKDDLQTVVNRLDPLLERHGFRFSFALSGVASLGEFATGFYVRDNIRIGLIVRSALGAVVYEAAGYKMSHGEYMAAIGHAEDCSFQFDKASRSAVGRGGMDPIEALIRDLTLYCRDLLDGEVAEFLRLMK